MRSRIALTAIFIAASAALGARDARAIQAGPTTTTTAGPLSVTYPVSVAPNAPFTVTVKLLDALGNQISAGDRIYVTLNRLGSQSLLMVGGAVTFSNLRATTVPVTLLVTDPARSLSRTVVLSASTPPTTPALTGGSLTVSVGNALNATFGSTGTPTPALNITYMPGSGVLPAGVSFNAGFGTATLTGTPGPAAAGTYSFIVVADNGQAATRSFTLTINNPVNLVVNGGFENGDTSGWTQEGSFQGVTGGGVEHSGSFGYFDGTVGGFGSLRQTLTTVPGATYTLSFWVFANGGSPNGFQVHWNGGVVYSISDTSGFPYTLVTISGLVATSTGTVLDFKIRHDPAYYYLDDVVVMQQ